MNQLYSVHDVERLKVLEAASKVLSFDTILEIKRQPDIELHGYVILDRWAVQQSDDLKNLGSKDFLHLFHHVVKQQEKELAVLLSPLSKEKEKHLTIHERLTLHEIDTRLILEF